MQFLVFVSSNICSVPLCFISPSMTLITYMLGHLILSYMALKLFVFLQSSFSLLFRLDHLY